MKKAAGTFKYVEIRRDPKTLPKLDVEALKQCPMCGEWSSGDATEMGMEHEVCAIPCPFCTIDLMNIRLSNC